MFLLFRNVLLTANVDAHVAADDSDRQVLEMIASAKAEKVEWERFVAAERAELQSRLEEAERRAAHKVQSAGDSELGALRGMVVVCSVFVHLKHTCRSGACGDKA